MSERPILFSAPMVKALLAGRKTQTRRIIKPRKHSGVMLFDGSWTDGYVLDPGNQSWREDAYSWRCGDRLWVRETWALVGGNDPGFLVTKADYPECVPSFCENIPMGKDIKWKPSIFMPRWASRLSLTVTDVRVQRLQDCSEDDAAAEGACEAGYVDDNDVGCRSYIEGYARLWTDINGPGSWEANPWIVALTFTVRQGNIDA